MTTEKILVTGATGTVGSALISELIRTNADVRAMVRDPMKAQSLRDAGVEVVEGDLDRPETLGPALAGISRIFLLTAPGPGLVAQELALLQAARDLGSQPPIVKLSAIGAGPDCPFLFGRRHGEVQEAIARSGLPYTFLQPNGFMQNLFGSADAIREQSCIFAPAGDGRISWIDARDVAAVAAKVLTGDGHAGKSYVLTGPESLSHAELAAGLSRHVGTEIRYVDVPPEGASQAMLQSGLSAWMVDGLIDLFANYRTGAADPVNDNVREITGVPPRTFDQFAAEFADRFKS